MAGRYTAQERIMRRKEALLYPPLPKTAISQVPPPPLPAPPLSIATGKKKRRSTFGLQRDYRVLEREKKVSTILEDAAFRSQLEGILQGQLEGKKKPNLARPQPNRWPDDSALHHGSQHQTPASRYGETVIPIDDLGGIRGSKYTLAERQTRCKLASVYRLVDLFAWSPTIETHITVSVRGIHTKISLGSCDHKLEIFRPVCLL